MPVSRRRIRTRADARASGGCAAVQRAAITHADLLARTEADVLDRELFVRWEAAHPNFRFIRTLTRGPGGDPHGRIPGILPELCPDLSDYDVFIAGASGFVRGCAIAADALGSKRKHTYTEPFFTEPQPWSGAAPRADEGV